METLTTVGLLRVKKSLREWHGFRATSISLPKGGPETAP